jgi:hypothetical protein
VGHDQPEHCFSVQATLDQVAAAVDGDRARQRADVGGERERAPDG